MRVLMKVTLPVEPANQLALKGRLGQTIQGILAELKPEAAYFTAVNGQRGGYLFLNLEDSSQIPAIAEPWFLAFNASIELHPVMNSEDLGRAAPAIEQAVKKYGAGA